MSFSTTKPTDNKKYCDHKFMNSKKCIKCSWKPSKKELEFMRGAEEYKRNTSMWN